LPASSIDFVKPAGMALQSYDKILKCKINDDSSGNTIAA
jgi:hypothetical protein